MFGIRNENGTVSPIDCITLDLTPAANSFAHGRLPNVYAESIKKLTRRVDFLHNEELWEGDTITAFGSGKGIIIWSEVKGAWCVLITESPGGSILLGDTIPLKDYHNFRKV